MLDIKTTLVGFILSVALQVIVVFILWRQHRSQYRGPCLWVIAYVMIFAGFCSTVFLNLTKTPIIITFINGLSLAGLIILLFGIEQFFERPISLWPNLVLYCLVVPGIFFFTYIEPSVRWRMVVYSFGNCMIWSQVAALVFYRLRPPFVNSGCSLKQSLSS